MKRTLAVVLAMLLVFSLAPVQVFAADTMSTEEFRAALQTAVENGTDLILDRSVAIQENMEINLGSNKLILTNGSELGVAGGMTMKLTGLLWVRHGTVNVNPGGAMDITPGSKVIIGAEGLVLDGVRYESEGGSAFNVNGSLFCGGSIDIIPDGSMWITHPEADAHIDGSCTNMGAVHVIDGLLEVTNALNTCGYLAVHPNGKLQTNTGSTLNILNNEDGCGYLDNQGFVKLSGTVNVDGLCSTGKNSETGEGNGTMEVWDATINIGETGSLGIQSGGNIPLNNSTLNGDGTITIEKEGALWINNDSALNVNAALDNLGFLHVGFEGNGTLNVKGTLSTNGYLAVHPSGALNAEEDSELNVLNDENGCGYLDNSGMTTLDGSVNLDGLFTTNTNIGLNGTMNAADTSSIGVLDGGVFNVNGNLNSEGEVTVETFGKLYVNDGGVASLDCPVANKGIVLVPEGGTLIVSDAWEGNEPVDQGGTISEKTVPMFRMYDPNSGEHFYSGSELERDFLVEAGWHYEGVGFNFPVEGDPVYRLYDPVHGEHLYTMDEAEKNKLLDEGWQYEGVAFNSAGTDEVPQYRLHNPNAKRGGYHFTGSEVERDLLISLGWILQGIGWYSCLE